MRNFRFIGILAIVSMLFMAGACSKIGAMKIGEKAPDFELQDLNGKTVSLSDFKGRVIILDFFASWCPPCRQEIPDFIKLQDSYGSKGFSMIGISLEGLNETKDFAKRVGINYPVLIDDGKASAVYGPIRSIPTTFTIDKNSKIAKLYIGYRAKEIFEKDIKELIAK